MKKKILISSLISFALLATAVKNAAAAISPPGLGFGVCHWPGTGRYAESVNWFYWGGGEENWNKIEPVKGQYTFAKLDKQLADQFTAKPNTSMWLNIMTAMPDTVPEWAKNDPALEYIKLKPKNASTFPIWNPAFQQVFTELLTKISEHLYAPSFPYRDKIKAVVMMSGGSFGEMITRSDCPNGDDCKKYLAAGYTDEKYLEALVNWLAPLYLRLFPDYPIVLQLGGGIYGNDTGGTAANRLVDKYGSRIYVKWNGWNRKYAQEGSSTDRYYHRLMASLADRARVGFEPGYPWAIPDNESAEMQKSIYDSITATLKEVPVSYFCLQDKYYQILTAEQVRELSSQMRGIDSPTAPIACDFDGNGQITLNDFKTALIHYGQTENITCQNTNLINGLDLAKIMLTL
ncbi:MAG: hypothetical protein ABH807_00385 [Candidatus Shapirobacteria bacterium]